MQLNAQYQQTIKELENVVINKDRIITDHMMTISRLTEGSAQELQDIKLMFFSKQKELVQQIAEQRAKFKKQNDKYNKEIKVWEATEKIKKREND